MPVLSALAAAMHLGLCAWVYPKQLSTIYHPAVQQAGAAAETFKLPDWRH